MSLEVSLCIYLQGNFLSLAGVLFLSCVLAMGQMKYSSSWDSLANCLGNPATQSLNPENGLILPFAFHVALSFQLCSSKASLSRRRNGIEMSWLQLRCQVSYFVGHQ